MGKSRTKFDKERLTEHTTPRISTIRTTNYLQKVVFLSTSILVSVIVLYPLGMLIVSSFSPTQTISDISASPLQGYLLLFREWELVRNSIVIAIGATALALTFGITLAWILTRAQIPFKNFLEQLVIIPFYMSPLLGALGWIVLASPGKVGLINVVVMQIFGLSESPFNIYTPLGIIWVLGIFFTPFSFLIISAALRSMDPSLEESSRVIGAGKFRTAFIITLPVVKPAILNSALLIFILSLGNFAVPAVIGMPQGYLVMTTRIFQYVSGFDPNFSAAAAMGISLFVFGAIGVYLQSALLGGKHYTTVTGRAFRPRLIDVGRWKYFLVSIPIIYVLVTVVLPLGVMIWSSFLRWTTFDIKLAEFTLANYHFILNEYPITIIAIKNSLIVAIIGASLTMSICFVLAWMVQRSKIPAVRILEYISIIPLSVPPMVFSIGLLWAWINFPLLPIYGTLWILILCNVTILLPYGVRTMSATIVQLDKNLEECAQVIGASWGKVIKTVTLPLISQGFLAGWTLIFVATLNELAAMALLVTSNTMVLSVAVYDLFNQNTYPNVAVMALLQAIIIVIVLAIARAIGKQYGVTSA